MFVLIIKSLLEYFFFFFEEYKRLLALLVGNIHEKALRACLSSGGLHY